MPALHALVQHPALAHQLEGHVHLNEGKMQVWNAAGGLVLLGWS